MPRYNWNAWEATGIRDVTADPGMACDLTALPRYAEKWHARVVHTVFNETEALRAGLAMYAAGYGLDRPEIEILPSMNALFARLELMHRSYSEASRSNLSFEQFLEHMVPLRYQRSIGNIMPPGIYTSEGSNLILEMGTAVDAFKWLCKKAYLAELPEPEQGERYDESIMDEVYRLGSEGMVSGCIMDLLVDQNPDSTDRWRPFVDMAWNTPFYLAFKSRLFIVRFPTVVSNALFTMKPRESARNIPDATHISWSNGDVAATRSGIFIPRRFMRPPAEINIDDVLAVHDVDLRRVLVSMIGVQEFIKRGGAEVIDKGDPDDPNGYQIVNFSIEGIINGPAVRNSTYGDGSMRKFFLKMKNRSVAGEWHFEGVPGLCTECTDDSRFMNCPFRKIEVTERGEVRGTSIMGGNRNKNTGCDTVEKALYFRNGTVIKPKNII